MRVVIAKTMPEFSMDIYAQGLISGLRAVRPDWEIIELSPEPIDRRNHSIWVRIRKYYDRFWNFPRRVREQAADVVHIMDAAEAHMVSRLKQIDRRTVVTCHDLINYFYTENLKTSGRGAKIGHYVWLWAIRGMKFADRIVAVSTVTAKDTSEILDIDPKRITVVPNAVEPNFRPYLPDRVQTIRQQYGIEPNTLCLLAVGSEHPRKNLRNSIEALAILQERGLSFVLLKVGADFTDEQKQRIENLHLDRNIRYLGKPDRASLIDIYNAADVLIFPSLFEGFGMPLLEAMACGTPVVTSNVSAMPEVVGDDCLLVDPHSPESIAAAICQLHDNPSLKHDLIDRGLARVKLFAWENTAEHIAKIYEEIAGE